MFKIQKIALNSLLYEEMLALHAKKKSTLGPFPKGAFEEHANKGLIFGAIDDAGKLAGYILYRRTRSKASIVHLTRQDEFKGTGVTKILAHHVLEETKDLLGVGLTCRQDYRLNNMWSGLGFTIRRSRAGRGSDGALVDCWWYDHGHADLFSNAAEAEDNVRLAAAIDANVLYDLSDESRPHHDDTSVLLTDWLQDNIELCVTKELYHEIARCTVHTEQEKSRRIASGFRELKTSNTIFETALAKLHTAFGIPTDTRDASDMKQLAHSIAAEVPFFVTRDEPMLGRRDKVLELFPIEILHPTSLINHFDALRRGAAYRPALLEGSAWQRRLALATDVEAIVSDFKAPQEKKGDFERRVRGFLAHPDTYIFSLVSDSSGQLAVLAVEEKKSATNKAVLELRHSKHPVAPTLVRHIIYENCTDTDDESYISVSDASLSEETRVSLKDLGFTKANGNWHKLSVHGLKTFDEAKTSIRNSSLPEEVRKALGQLEPDEANRRLLEIILSPIKITGLGAHAFVVSIWKGWAEQLFTISLDGQALLGTSDRLLLGIEGVYYCSGKNKFLCAPSRVLWYISQGPDGKGPMSIVACSQMEEIHSGKPKTIFAKFRNLGVYSWPQVFETAGHSLDEELIAFRFVRTEKFRNPVSKEVLESLGVPQPQNPRKISDEQFASIYRLGMHRTTQ